MLFALKFLDNSDKVLLRLHEIIKTVVHDPYLTRQPLGFVFFPVGCCGCFEIITVSLPFQQVPEDPPQLPDQGSSSVWEGRVRRTVVLAKESLRHAVVEAGENANLYRPLLCNGIPSNLVDIANCQANEQERTCVQFIPLAALWSGV